MGSSIVRVTTIILAALQFGAAPAVSAHDEHAVHARTASATTYTRSVQRYTVPALSLIDASGRPVALHELLDTDKPVLVNFVFTSCSAICPVMTAAFAKLQERLGPDRDRVRLVSVSIDPEHDTPARLREYARRFHAGADWHFLTGTRDEIIGAQRAFDAFRGNKTNHTPLTFVRAGARAQWVRLEGLASAEQLLQEIARPGTP